MLNSIIGEITTSDFNFFHSDAISIYAKITVQIYGIFCCSIKEFDQRILSDQFEKRFSTLSTVVVVCEEASVEAVKNCWSETQMLFRFPDKCT
jgi:hypothetical protein